MPLMPGLLRRKGLASDADMRRHSFYTPTSESNDQPPVPSIDGRASEQIPRRPSATEFLSTTTGTDGPAPERTADEVEGEPQRSVSPPIQEETHKHRRFSMLKFRHASDSQLSTRGSYSLI